MTDPTPKPVWVSALAARHVQEPTPDESTDPPTWPEDAVQEVALLKDAAEWHAQEAVDARTHAEQVEDALKRAESNARGKQVQIEAQRAKLDAVRARVRDVALGLPEGSDLRGELLAIVYIDPDQSLTEADIRRGQEIWADTSGGESGE